MALPVDAAIPNPITISHRERAQLDTRLVLAAGRLVSQKGFDILLEAWAQISPRHPEWRLRIVGSGRDEVLLKSQATRLNIVESVQFAPNTIDMASEFRLTSIISPVRRVLRDSHWLLLRARSFGVPVVSFDS